MEKDNIFESMMNDVNELFDRVFSYNSVLLTKCNDNEYNPTFNEIYDFYITSNAMTFLKNFYYHHIESPAMFLNIRCIIEGIAIKEAYKKGKLDEFNLELLKKQDALIEYKQYKNFADIYEIFMMPEDIEQKYNDAVSFYKSTLCSFSDDEVMKIVNSPIPFLCDSKFSYRKIISDNLGEDIAQYYSFLSVYIHPNSNDPISLKALTHILIDTLFRLINEYKDLPLSAYDLKYYGMAVTSSPYAKKLNDLIKAECEQFEKIEAIFNNYFGENYVSDTFYKISMTIQEMALDAIFGFSEQVKGKWKIMLELISGFYDIYLNNDNVPASFNLLVYHEEVSKDRVLGDEEKLGKDLKLAYEYYLEKYPGGVDFKQFSLKFVGTCGFTIDAEGKVKTITQLVNQLCDLFGERVKEIKISDVLKLNYVEAQMVSHANGYLWYANTGAWADIQNVFTNFNYVISFICFYMSNIFKDNYLNTKEYKDKRISNVLKQAANFIKGSMPELFEVLSKINLNSFEKI